LCGGLSLTPHHIVTLDGLLDETPYELRLHSDNTTVVDTIGGEPIIITTTAAEPTQSDVAWTAGAAPEDLTWARGRNWKGMYPPAVETAGTIIFGYEGYEHTGIVETDRTVGGLRVPGAAAMQTHSLDLDSNTLTIAGDWEQRWLLSTMNLQNGTLQLGNEATQGSIDLRNFSNNWSVLNMGSGVVLDTYNTNAIRLSGWVGEKSILNLIGGSIAPRGEPEKRILETNTLDLGRGSYIQIDNTTNIDEMLVRQLFNVLGGYDSYIGDPADKKLPDGLDLAIGVDANNRADVIIRLHNNNSPFTLRARSGGTFTAWLELFDPVVATTGTPGTSGVITVDLSAMNSCQIDANTGGIGGTGRAHITLPSGTARFGSLYIGHESVGDSSLTLNGTLVEITNDLELNTTGKVVINVGEESSGMLFEGSLTDNGGTIHVNFNEQPVEDVCWALKLAGDQTSTLGAMVAAERLTSTVDEGIIEKMVHSYYDEVTGYTYYALIDEGAIPPVVEAQDATFEIEPAGTVLVRCARCIRSGRQTVHAPDELRRAGTPKRARIHRNRRIRSNRAHHRRRQRHAR